MIYLRCKCGKSEWFGSDMPKPCQGCEECGTTYAGSPNDHKPVIPHDPKPQFNRDTGKPDRAICKRCYASLKIPVDNVSDK